MDEVLEKNISLLCDIAVGDETNPLVIETVFQEIYQSISMMNPVNMREILLWLRRYFILLSQSMIYEIYREEDFLEYRHDILECLKHSFVHKKYLKELKKEFLKCQKNGEYSMLPHLYILFYMIVSAMDIREYYLIEKGNILYYSLKSITYLPREEIKNPFVYDEDIKESMLELKNS